MSEHIYACPECCADVDATLKENQDPQKICYICPNCKTLTPKHIALRLMEARDGKRRWSIRNFLDDGINPFTGIPFSG
jgi:hypothetical protein